MINTTLRELVLSRDAIGRLNEKENKLRGKDVFRLAGLMTKLQVELDNYQKAHKVIIDRHLGKGEDKRLVEELSATERASLDEEYEELLDTEVKISDSPVPVSMLDAGGIVPSIGDMTLMLFLFKEDEVED